MHNLPKGRRFIFAIFVVIVIGVVVAYAIITLSDETASPRTRVAAGLSTTTALLALIQVLPTLGEILRPTKKLSDEEIENAFSELELAMTALRQRQYKQAVEKATFVIGKLPKQAEAYRVRARANEALGKPASALEDYARAIELEPGHPYVYSGRAALLKKMGEHKNAIPDMLKSLALAPDMSGQLFQLADAHFSLGNFRKAERWFQEVLNHPETTEKEKRMSEEFISRLESMKHHLGELEDQNMAGTGE